MRDEFGGRVAEACAELNADWTRFSAPLGVEPLTGSAGMSVLGSPRRVAAMPRRWPMPRENPPTRLVATLARPVISMTSLTTSAGPVP